MVTHNHMTLAMIKPDASSGRKVGRIISRIEEEGFSILGAKMIQFKPYGAAEFYVEHKDKPFFEELTHFVSRGPVWALILFKENAVEDFRKLLGSTNSAEADPGTLRHEFGNHKVIRENAVHGSATPADAAREIDFFFGEDFRAFQENQSRTPLV